MLTEETARKQLETLHQEGSDLATAFAEEEGAEDFEVGYQRWYSRALPLMKRLAPDRYAEFQRFYSRDPKIDVHWSRNHVIQDVIWGVEDDTIDFRQEAARCFWN
jgi:Mlc titration factor MtfA (ptsG expression regulator)